MINLKSVQMQVNFQSTNPIIVQYPRFAGGKFLSNCLSLSKHCVPQDAIIAEYLLNYPEDYQYRIEKLLQTLPTFDKMNNWISEYELGDSQLFGNAHLLWRDGLDDEFNTNEIVNKLSSSNLKFFITCHSVPEEILNLNKIWKNSKIIMLKNYRKFYDIASKLKSNQPELIKKHAGNYCKESYDIIKGNSWPSWDEFEKNNYISNNLEIQEFYKWHLIPNKIMTYDVDNNKYI